MQLVSLHTFLVKVGMVARLSETRDIGFGIVILLLVRIYNAFQNKYDNFAENRVSTL